MKKQRFPRYTTEELNKSSKDSLFKSSLGREFRREWRDKLSKETMDYIKSDKRIPLKEYVNSRGNSYDWKTRAPMLSNEALVSMIENNLKNCMSVKGTTRFCTDNVYETALVNTLVPILLDRLEELIAKLNEVENHLACGAIADPTD